jgi:hypothetical protein
VGIFRPQPRAGGEIVRDEMNNDGALDESVIGRRRRRSSLEGGKNTMAIDYAGSLLISTGKSEDKEQMKAAVEQLRQLMTQMRGPTPWEADELEDLVEERLGAPTEPDGRAFTCGLSATLVGYRLDGSAWSPRGAQALYEYNNRRWPAERFVAAMSKRWRALTFAMTWTSDCSWSRALLRFRDGKLLSDRFEENALAKQIGPLFDEYEALAPDALPIAADDTQPDLQLLEVQWACEYDSALRRAFDDGRDDLIDSDLATDWQERLRQSVIAEVRKKRSSVAA